MKRKTTTVPAISTIVETLIDPSGVCDETNSLFVDPPISNPPMNKKIVPPPNMWSKIERILDEQDKAKLIAASVAKSILASTLRPTINIRGAFAALGMCIFACLVGMFF